MSEPTIVTETRPGAVLIGLNRPAKKNAIDERMVAELTAALDAANRGAPAILVLFSTTPGMFASGADIRELMERRADDALRSINAGLFDRIESHRWPTIAAVDGSALGGGCELALACDMRVASRRARFAQPELNLGILAGAGANWRLVQLVGLSLARRMLYTGSALDADAALLAGLVESVHEPDKLLDAALALGRTIGERSWRALELTKLALRQHRPATTLFDIASQALLFESEEKQERMGAVLDRRSSSTP